MSVGPNTIPGELIALLRCPRTGRALRVAGDRLVTEDGTQSYAVTPTGIPLFASAGMSDEAEVQQRHYDRIAGAYVTNLTQDHTREYMAFLDRELLAVVGDTPLGTVAEICCGAGEAFHLLSGRARAGVGVDVSSAMLEVARRDVADRSRLFVQGDAVRLPLADGTFDTVFMLGGIHHVNDRARLFAEVHRILRPGGRFFWREPVDDFGPWRWLRQVIYRASPTLEADTEHPLRREETERQLAAAGFRVTRWRTLGFLAYCFLMNGDVLVFNRLFQYVPGIRGITRAAARADELTLRIPGLRDAGLIVVGSAVAEAGR